MLKTAVIAISAASSLTYGAAGLYETARSGAMHVANVYEVAGEIASTDGQRHQDLDAKLYKASEGLNPYADFSRHN